MVAKSMETGFRHIRLQYGEGGYGGGGFIRANEGNRAEGGYQGQAFDEDFYVETIPPVFEYVRSKVGIRAQAAARRPLAPDGERTRFCLPRRWSRTTCIFVEDLLGPEHLDWYHEVRKVCATPQAVGEVFSNPAEYYPLISGAADRFHPDARDGHRRNHAGEEDRQSVRGLRRQDGLSGRRRERSGESTGGLPRGHLELAPSAFRKRITSRRRCTR